MNWYFILLMHYSPTGGKDKYNGGLTWRQAELKGLLVYIFTERNKNHRQE